MLSVEAVFGLPVAFFNPHRVRKWFGIEKNGDPIS
jgi:hypothetical protein